MSLIPNFPKTESYSNFSQNIGELDFKIAIALSPVFIDFGFYYITALVFVFNFDFNCTISH